MADRRAQIEARYPGTCFECGGRWQPGDLIRLRDVPGASTWYVLPDAWRHVSCPDLPREPPRPPHLTEMEDHDAQPL